MAADTGSMPLEDVVRFLEVRLGEPLPGARAQGAFAPVPLIEDWAPDLLPETARRAAALLLLHPGPNGPTIPLTLRRADLPHHPGQISLPGGALDPGEAVDAAALREAEEEVGLARADVTVIGALSTLWIPMSNFVLTPIVAVSHATPLFRPHAAEVDAMLDLPLAWVVDRARIRWAERDRRGLTIRYPYFDVNGAHVWGATGMILNEFACLFDPDRVERGV
jgi:8-oxo-dGTP pyrophosphatase MutT (NUDIX family)